MVDQHERRVAQQARPPGSPSAPSTSCCAAAARRRRGRACPRRSWPPRRGRRSPTGRRRTRAQELRAKAPVDVLEVGEEGLVEQPHLVERGAPIRRRPRARAEHPPGRVVLPASPSPCPRSSAIPRPPQRIPRRVDHAAVVEAQHLRRRRGGPGSAQGPPTSSRRKSGRSSTSLLISATNSPGARAIPRLTPPQSRCSRAARPPSTAGPPLAQVLHRAVCRAVVDDDDLDRRKDWDSSEPSAASSSARPFQVGMTTGEVAVTACRAPAPSDSRGRAAAAAAPRRQAARRRRAERETPVSSAVLRRPCRRRAAPGTRAPAGACGRDGTASRPPARAPPARRRSAARPRPGVGHPRMRLAVPRPEPGVEPAVELRRRRVGRKRDNHPPARCQRSHHLPQRRLALGLRQVLEHLQAQHGIEERVATGSASARPGRRLSHGVARSAVRSKAGSTPVTGCSRNSVTPPEPDPTSSTRRLGPPAPREQPQHRVVAQRGVEVAGAQPEAGRHGIGHGSVRS